MCGAAPDAEEAKVFVARLLVHMGHPEFRGRTCPYDHEHRGSCNLCFRDGGCSLVPLYLDVPQGKQL